MNSAKNKNAKLARWAAKLASYDFSIKHRAGRVHNNADGLSRAHIAPTSDTPAPGHTAIEATTLTTDCSPLLAALEAMASDPSPDGDLGLPTCREAATTLGPRQLLLEAAPCTSC